MVGGPMEVESGFPWWGMRLAKFGRKGRLERVSKMSVGVIFPRVDKKSRKREVGGGKGLEGGAMTVESDFP